MDYFDLHCDTLTRMFDENKDFCNGELDVNFNSAVNFCRWYQCFAIFIRENTDRPFDYYKKARSFFFKEIKSKCPDNLFPLLTVEGGSLIENDLKRIYELKNDGVFALTLTWNGENNIAGGANSDAPLKPFGKEAIKELNKCKICTDLSHLNRKSFLKALEIADFPIATHSCLNEINSHPRNLFLSDIKLIAEKGGITGFCLYPEFLGSKNVYDKIYENICLCLENGLENSIAIGSDFDGCQTPLNAMKIPKLYRYLQDRGINNKILDKIFYENAFLFFKSFDKR